MELIWADSAEADLFSIADHYAHENPDLPDKILSRIAKAALILIDQPRLGTPIDIGLRKWRARRTPFILLYRVSETQVEIARVVHAAQDWRGQ